MLNDLDGASAEDPARGTPSRSRAAAAGADARHDRAGTEDTSAAREDTADDEAEDALLSRLRLIEERPLEERAEAYLRIHGELLEALEGEETPPRDV